MSDQRPTAALDGLGAFEQARRARNVPKGSAGLQLFGSLIVPGLPSMRRLPLLGIVLFVAGVAAPIVLAAWAFSRRDDIVALALDPQVLTAAGGIALALALTRLFAIAEVAFAFRKTRGIGIKTVLATIVALVLAAPVLVLAFRANEARSAVASVFGSEGGPALFEPTGEDGVDLNAVTTVLLLGGDAGPGRWGLRTDSMILVSIHEATGRTALVSIPRNLMRLRFPPNTPLANEFPNGFSDLANAVFPYVSTRDELLAFYGGTGRGEAVALAGAIGFSLDVEIDDFALVNMQGFTEVIDAVGGVTLDLAQTVPLPPSIEGERPLPAEIGPGRVEMDGALAIAYVRSRSADSDYQRMARQRQLLSALGSQVSPGDAAAGFGKVTGVLDDSMRTSLSGGEFSDLLDRLGDNSNVGESIGLVPPLVEPGSPDYDEIRRIIDAVENYVLTGRPSGFAT